MRFQANVEKGETTRRIADIYNEHQHDICKRTDHMFAVLMALQWIGGVVAAYWISPKAWIGTTSHTHIHVWVALFLGGAISSLPIFLAITRPGRSSTRYTIAVGQMLMGGLLIHLTGGRIETHFHVFGSLAFLSFYRDWRLLVPATIIVAADHILRGVFWPQSVYGVLTASNWRWVEHAGWVLFEDIFLLIVIKRSVGEMWDIATRTVASENLNLDLESRVVERTTQLAAANRDLEKEVAERRRAADSLKQSEEWLTAIFESSRDGIIVEENECIVYVNQSYAHLFGYEPEELMGQSVWLVSEQEPSERMLEYSRRRMRGEEAPSLYPFRGTRKDGTPVDLEASVSTAKIGEKAYIISLCRDITERKRMEQERQIISEIIQGAITTSDLNELLKLIHCSISRCLYAENCFVALYDEATDLMHFEFWVDQFDPCPSPRPIGAGFSSYVLRTGQPLLLDRELTAQMYRSGKVEKSGSPSASWLGVPLRTPSRTIGVLVVQHYEDELAHTQRDLDFLSSVGGQIALAIERKQAEKEIARLAPFPDQNPSPVIETDLEGKVSYLNPIAARQFPDLEALGAQHPILQDLAAIIEQFRYQEEGCITREVSVGESLYEQNITRASNSIRIYSHDLTERKCAAEELARQRAFLRQIIDLNPSFIFAKDRAGRFTLVNQALAESYGTTVEGLLGKTDADFNPNKEEVEWFRRDDLEVMDSHKEKFIPEEVITDASGQVRWLQTIKRPIVSADGTADQVLGIATDITARKQTEEALNRSEEQLRRAGKMEAVGQLAGGVAHDFNNLLTVINGYSDICLRRLAPEDPLCRNIQEIKKAGGRAASLTRQLLAFSRKQILQPKVIDLNSVVVETNSMLQRLIGEDIDLMMGLGAVLGMVKADPNQIEQVLLNLAVNARDAMPLGGKLTIETTNVHLGAEYARSHIPIPAGKYVLLAMSDNGHGMDEQTQARIFEPFFTTKEVGKGTGLGLATVYGIVKQSEGYIWVYSEVGRGTTFKVYLPSIEDAAEKATGTTEDAELLKGIETVLLVEDEELVRNLTAEILRESGYQVLEAKDGNAALMLAKQHDGDIHLMLTDVVMPQMSGRELAEQLATVRKDMRVLYMSGYTDDAIVLHGVLDEGTPFIGKPFNATALARKVREVLDSTVIV